jgi:hypothetical protein
MSMFLNGLEARTHWALHVVRRLAGNERSASAEHARALGYARRCGQSAAQYGGDTCKTK